MRSCSPTHDTDPDQMLASYMSHELRAPLISIRSALGILDEQFGAPPDSDAGQILSLALKNTERLDALITDILDYGRLQAGRMTMAANAERPEGLMQEAVESMRPWAQAKGVLIAWAKPEPPLPPCIADRRRAVQVLVNLLSNAIKFTPEGGRIAVSAEPGSGEDLGAVAFTVRDTGPGIPGNDLERIFRCFEQSALGAKTSRGTGLGLTLAKAMVELQGGRIWAQSPPGMGAAFTFTLPTSRSAAAFGRERGGRTQYHGLLVRWCRRLNSFMLALFA